MESVGMQVCFITMNKLFKMIEACARSEARMKLMEYKYNNGEMTASESIDFIVAETERVKKELQKIKGIDKKQFILDRKIEVDYERN
jgi:hypothetical protein